MNSICTLISNRSLSLAFDLAKRVVGPSITWIVVMIFYKDRVVDFQRSFYLSKVLVTQLTC